ncbi:MAG TPA: DUF4126 domain-containing protein [Candidatus Methylomirabilis sp.]|nr:DUF4126 domain-containing protein [Candidatus Methylomirabilis sp.]
MEALLSIGLGVGLSAACGFRVFVPLLVMSIAALSGHLRLAPGFEWIGTVPALLAFATATLLEVLAYAIPWLDNLLDTLATPAAVLAAMLASASVMAEFPPPLSWGIAVIAGGATAGVVQGATVLLRLQSVAATGGTGNLLISTLELIGALTTALLALVLPVVCLFLPAILCLLVFRASGRFLFGRGRKADRAPAAPPSSPEASP